MLMEEFPPTPCGRRKQQRMYVSMMTKTPASARCPSALSGSNLRRIIQIPCTALGEREVALCDIVASLE
jgi:hypothetical protein